jgi:pentatricopeptide repeat protein
MATALPPGHGVVVVSKDRPSVLQFHHKSERVDFRHFLSSSASSVEYNGTITVYSWNAKAKAFLASETETDEEDAIGDLVNELLHITSSMFQKSISTPTNEDFVDSGYDWSFLGMSGSTRTTTSSFGSASSIDIQDAQKIDLESVFSLLHRLVEAERSQDLSAWSAFSTCLNPILQLWKHQHTSTSKRRGPQQSPILKPSQILEELDYFRQHSTILLPDVKSYNILLDAVATAPNSHRAAAISPNRDKNKSLVDVAFCESLWKWMWEESQQDALIRPDIVTIRSLFKAHVATGHSLAPQRCEELVEEWLKYNNARTNTDQHFKEEQQMSSMLQCLIHVWAKFDPKLAESYLKELADGVLEGKAYEPPSSSDWNRVISAYSIVHDQPAEGHRVLEDFWDFYDQISDSLGEKVKATHFMNAWKVGAPNLRSYNSVLEGYARQRNSIEANKVFSRLQMVASTSPSIATYTSVIKANAKNLKLVDALAMQCMDEWRKQKVSHPAGAGEISNHVDEAKFLSIDNGFFHAWLNACAVSKDISAAKKVLKHMKSCGLSPDTTTYLSFLNVFLAKQDPQAAIEWLLAYSKLESMSENEIVAWTSHLLQWYREHNASEVDSMVLLQILCENAFVSSDESIEKLISHTSGDEAVAILEWLPGKSQPTSRMRATVMRILSQDPSKCDKVEEIFLKWRSEIVNSKKTLVEEVDILSDMCASIIVAWSKRVNLKKVRRWLQIINGSPDLPPLNLTAQMAVVQAYCQGRDPEGAEQFVVDIEASYKRDGIASLPDTTMKNVVLKAWVNEGDGRRAAEFFNNHIEEPDIVSWNSVINAFCKAGNVDEAELWANNLVNQFHENPVGTPRPDSATFTVILAAWRQSSNGNAAIRAEKVLSWMHDLFAKGILLYRPNAISYNVVLDTWEKSPLPDAGIRAHELLSTSSFHNDKKLVSKVKRIQAKSQKKNKTKTSSAVA